MQALLLKLSAGGHHQPLTFPLFPAGVAAAAGASQVTLAAVVVVATFSTAAIQGTLFSFLGVEGMRAQDVRQEGQVQGLAAEFEEACGHTQSIHSFTHSFNHSLCLEN